MKKFIVNCLQEKVTYGWRQNQHVYSDEYEIGKFKTLKAAIKATNRSKDGWELSEDKFTLTKSLVAEGGYTYTYSITIQDSFDDEILNNI